MRRVHVDEIRDKVAEMCVKANTILPVDIKECIATAKINEDWPLAMSVLGQLEDNYKIAEDEFMPICQDTGVACFFIEFGQEVSVYGGAFNEAINEGVRRGYKDGFLRKSIVGDPLDRINTGDNTPAMIHTDIVEGDKIKIIFSPKGFGSENMSRLKMLKPSEGIEGIRKFVLDTVEKAGSNPCPPIVLGIGIGGTFDSVTVASKKALLRDITINNKLDKYKCLEEELLGLINETGIGPQGFGGRTTALAVNIEVLPTHIAGLPCAVNIGCHASRRMKVVI